MELEMDCLRLRKLFKNVSSAPMYEHFLVMLVSQVHMMAGQNVAKEKVPDVSDPNQNV